MNHTPGTIPTIPEPPSPGGPTTPPNWRAALADLIGARASLIHLEFRQAFQHGAKRGIFFGAAAFLLLFAWVIIVAGGVGAISASTHWPWYWVTLSVGGAHLLLAFILILIAKKPAPASFDATLAEFKKDREWLVNFQSPNKFND